MRGGRAKGGRGTCIHIPGSSSQTVTLSAFFSPIIMGISFSGCGKPQEKLPKTSTAVYFSALACQTGDGVPSFSALNARVTKLHSSLAQGSPRHPSGTHPISHPIRIVGEPRAITPHKKIHSSSVIKLNSKIPSTTSSHSPPLRLFLTGFETPFARRKKAKGRREGLRR